MTDPATTPRSVRRLLRLAVSAIGLAACLLLSGLWLRSYWWLDFGSCEISNTLGVFALSQQGQLRIIFGWNVPPWAAPVESSVVSQIWREFFAVPNTPHRIPAAW